MEDKRITVLIVDDEIDFRQLMTFWLESKGYKVMAASNGKIALQMMKENSPDIVFMDLRMPEMDGVETTKKIREFNQEVPIIIISAYVDDPRAKDVAPYGVSGIFYKGKDFKEGLTLIETALRMHKKLQK